MVGVGSGIRRAHGDKHALIEWMCRPSEMDHYKICNRPLDNPADPLSQDCRGLPILHGTIAEDPDCIAAVAAILGRPAPKVSQDSRSNLSLDA
jgi:hypothetical protein